MNHVDKPCQRCGEMMHQVARARQYCKDCKLLNAKERQSAEQKKLIDKPCLDCGAEMFQVLPSANYCPSCRAKRRGGTGRHRRKKQKQKPATIREINKQAAECGLSYGHFVHKLRMEQMKGKTP